jgi:hypothetical protein
MARITSVFAQEIFDLIIDQLHDDRPALRTCALVSKSWTPRSRFQFFKHVTVKIYTEDHEQTGTFFGLLRSPHQTIVPFIRSLSIEHTEPFDEWAMKTIPRLQALPAVSALIFHSRDRTAIWSFPCYRDTLTDLTLSGICGGSNYHLFKMICSFPQLERLSSNCFGASDANPNPDEDLSISKYLRTLSIRVNSRWGLLSWLSSLKTMPSVHKLCLTIMKSDQFSVAGVVLRRLGSSLKRFKIYTFVGLRKGYCSILPISLALTKLNHTNYRIIDQTP